MRSKLILTGALALACSGVVAALAATKAAPACDQQIVMQVDSAKVSVEPDGIAIDVFGVSESAGWKNATLVKTGTSGGTTTVDFVGCRPEVSAQKLTPIQASVTLDLDLATTNEVIIRAKTNSMTVSITK